MGLPPTGKHVSFGGKELFHISDGKFVESWGEFDFRHAITIRRQPELTRTLVLSKYDFLVSI